MLSELTPKDAANEMHETVYEYQEWSVLSDWQPMAQPGRYCALWCEKYAMTVLFVPVTGGNGVQDIVGMIDCGLMGWPVPVVLRACCCVVSRQPCLCLRGKWRRSAGCCGMIDCDMIACPHLLLVSALFCSLC
jgi:hypothetical protein